MVFKQKSVVVLSNTGCFLPVLIAINLMFGWIFLKPMQWLGLEVILILLFVVNAFFFLKQYTGPITGRGAIDVDAEVLDEEKGKLK